MSLTKRLLVLLGLGFLAPNAFAQIHASNSGVITAVNGGIVLNNPKTVTADYTATSTDTLIAVDATAGSNITVTLPPAGNKQEIMVVRIDTTAAIVSVNTKVVTEVLTPLTTFFHLQTGGNQLHIQGINSSSWTILSADVAPDYIGPDIPATGVMTIGVASDTIACSFTTRSTARVSGIRFAITTADATGIVDAEIFNSRQTLISSGTMLTTAATGSQTLSLINPVILPPGQYYVGLQASAPVAQFAGSSIGAGDMPKCRRYAGTAMGASMAGTNNTTTRSIAMYLVLTPDGKTQ